MDSVPWYTNWAWSTPLIVLTVTIHVFGLQLINARFVKVLTGARSTRRFTLAFALSMSAAAVGATALHAFEAAIWAGAYLYLGALPDNRSAMLYSLGAMTTLGNSALVLDAHWRMMGAVEALNGILLFGLTTAFLFAMIQEGWRLGEGVESEGGRR